MTVEDVRRLMGASTPTSRFSCATASPTLIAGLPADHPARVEGEREIARLERLGFSGETRGERATPASARCPRCHRSTGRPEPAPEGLPCRFGEGPLAAGVAKRPQQAEQECDQGAVERQQRRAFSHAAGGPADESTGPRCKRRSSGAA